jgi:hypothetical protein
VIVVPGGTHSVAVNGCVWSSATVAFAGETMFAPQTISTFAEADFVLSAALVAVTLTVGGVGGAGGAVYVAVSAPVLATVPSIASPPATPFTLHRTLRSGCPDPPTLAVNPCAIPVVTVAAVGATFTVTSLSIPTLAAPLAEGAATLVAFTVTLAGDGRSPGAVYNPVFEIVPTVAFPPATPFTLHVTRVSVVPVTVAVNACVAPRKTIALVGATLTVTFGGGPEPEEPTEPHPEKIPDSATNAARRIRLVHARAILISAAPPSALPSASRPAFCPAPLPEICISGKMPPAPLPAMFPAFRTLPRIAPRTPPSVTGAVARTVPNWSTCRFALNAARYRLRFLAGTSSCLQT